KDQKARDSILKAIRDLFEINYTGVEVTDKISLPGSWQVLDFREFQYFAILSIAIPGSSTVNPAEVAELFPGKMVKLNLIPEQGPIKTSWIKGWKKDISAEVIHIFSKALNKALQEPGNRQFIFSEAKEKLESDTENARFLQLLSMYLFMDEFNETIFSNSIFGDYQPKTSPDVAADYMPDIIPELSSLPKTSPENFGELFELFKFYSAAAEKIPGKWVEGNMVLGARPKEYKPSKEELILDEIGERILNLIDKYPAENLKNKLAEALPGKEYCYTHFTFIHMDVMGSGRFFYVSNMENKCFKTN
ncbi:MAG: hypothetical protein JXR31_17095, partial [Prolixibacteraceae bacterium]|nr:hypothetical protein [Prolixibacteraceae bacterium]